MGSPLYNYPLLRAVLVIVIGILVATLQCLKLRRVRQEIARRLQEYQERREERQQREQERRDRAPAPAPVAPVALVYILRPPVQGRRRVVS